MVRIKKSLKEKEVTIEINLLIFKLTITIERRGV